MSEQAMPVNTFKDGLALELPAYKGQPAISLDISKLKEAEKRAIDAKTVNPATYLDLETCFGEAFRELKSNLATVGYAIAKTESEFEKAKAIALMDKYPMYLEAKKEQKIKIADTADARKSFLALDSDVQEAKDRLDSLQVLQFFLEGRVTAIENLSRFMKKQMDLIIRSGVNPTLYYK